MGQDAVGVRLNGASESMESLVGMLVRITAQMAKPQRFASLDRLPGVELCDLAAKLLNTMLDLLGVPLEPRMCNNAHVGWHTLLHLCLHGSCFFAPYGACNVMQQ